MFEFLSQSAKFILGTSLILNSSLWSLMRFSAFLGLRYADDAIMWSFAVFWHSCSLFFFCPSLFCFLNLALFMTPLRTGTVWCANNKWQLSCRWGQAVSIAGVGGKSRITITCPYPTRDVLQRDHVLWRRVCNRFLFPPLSTNRKAQHSVIQQVAILNFCRSLTARQDCNSLVVTDDTTVLWISL